jgi:hypothetical protein
MGVIIDVSSNNAHPIDYKAVVAGGVIGVIVKATEGTGYTNPFYAQDVAGFQAAGVPVLAYHFASFGDVAAEAAHFKSVAGPLAKVLDSETNTDAGWQNRFLDLIGPGTVMNYGSKSSLPRTSSLLWVAIYGGNPGPGYNCWQFTDSQWIAGHPYDASLWTDTPANFDALFQVWPPTPPLPPPPPPSPIQKKLTGKVGKLNAPIVKIVTTHTGNGYIEIGADGGTFNYGDAKFLGSLGGVHLNAPIVSGAITSTDKGLILVATDGGVFCFGDASFHGSEAGKPLNAPVVDIALSPSGKGYSLVASDGGVFCFGDSTYHGSASA